VSSDPAPGTALVRRPGPRLAGEAAAQWADFVEAVADAGWAIKALPPVGDALEDVFIADEVVVVEGTALLTRPCEEPARPGSTETEKAVRELGLAVTRVEAPVMLHGADVVFVRPREDGFFPSGADGGTVYVGRSGRTTDDAACEIAKRACGPSVRVVPVAVHDLPHLSAAMTALPEGTLIGLPDHVDTSALPGLQVALEPAGAHVAVLGERRLLLSAAAPRTAARLRADGYDVTSVQLSGFESAGGTVNRLAVLIRR
jgi:dimethylargininase